MLTVDGVWSVAAEIQFPGTFHHRPTSLRAMILIIVAEKTTSVKAFHVLPLFCGAFYSAWPFSLLRTQGNPKVKAFCMKILHFYDCFAFQFYNSRWVGTVSVERMQWLKYPEE